MLGTGSSVPSLQYLSKLPCLDSPKNPSFILPSSGSSQESPSSYISCVAVVIVDYVLPVISLPEASGCRDFIGYSAPSTIYIHLSLPGSAHTDDMSGLILFCWT